MSLTIEFISFCNSAHLVTFDVHMYYLEEKVQIGPYHMNQPCSSRTLHGAGFDSYGMARSVSPLFSG